MTLYDFLEYVIDRLENRRYIDWINVIVYKKDIEFPILRMRQTGWWDYDETVSKYKILHMISEPIQKDSTVLNIVVEECEVEE